MIAINLEFGFEIYLTILLGGIGIYGIREFWRSQNWQPTKDKLCSCQSCQHIFVVKRGETVARCPKCDKLANISRR